jgi:hypothetical protein
MPEIPDRDAQTEANDEALSQSVAEMTQEMEAPEADPYAISFAKYNDRACELSLLVGNKPKKVVESLKKIGTLVPSTADFQRQSIDRTAVRNQGAYRRLFRGFEDDIELKELKLQQSARIFYFDIEPKRTMYVVAITNNHLETNQVRR